MYRYSEADRQIIAAARKRNKDKRAEKRLYALELRAAGKSAEERKCQSRRKWRRSFTAILAGTASGRKTSTRFTFSFPTMQTA